MSRLNPLERAVAAAIAGGHLPRGTTPPSETDQRPWPVVLLMALGAWLAALPLLGVLATLFGGLLRGDAGPYVAGGALLAAAFVVLRARGVALFFEQLAVPALLTGLMGLGVGLFRDLGTRSAALTLAALALGLGTALPQAWLRVPLGAAAAALGASALLGPWSALARLGGPTQVLLQAGLAWQGVMALALGALAAVAGGRAGPPRLAAAADGLGAGALLGTLAGLASWSGMSFLVGGATGAGVVGELGREIGRHGAGSLPGNPWLTGLSVLLALAALALLAQAWPALRRAPWAAAALPLAALAAFVPALGAALLAAAACARMHRFRLAAAAALVALWAVGGFYYALAWPLGLKAPVLVAAGAWLGGCAWWARGREAAASASTPPAALPGAAWLGLVCTALVVATAAGLGAWRNERLIARGQPVLVEIVPVDPRSLMQGDFMRLAFRLSPDVPPELGRDAHRPHVLLQLDERGVATPLRLWKPGEALQPGQLHIELAPSDGRWTLVTDAWYFREGEAARWAGARYGEFRVQPGGQALLVGLRDAQLQPL